MNGDYGLYDRYRWFLVLVLLLLAWSVEAAPPGRKINRESLDKKTSVQAGVLPGQPQGGAEGDEESTTEDDSVASDSQVAVPRRLNFRREERERAVHRGYSWYLESSGEYYHTLKDPSGERNRSYYQDAYLELTIDLKKARLGSQGTAFLSLVGGKEFVFSTMPTSRDAGGVLVPADTNPGAGGSFQLYELWYERKIGKALWLAGLRDISSDFCVLRFNEALTNSGFWFNQAVSTNVPLAIYDLTTLGVRAAYPLCRNLQLVGGVFEGTPGTSDNNPHGWRWRISSDEGWFRIIEFQAKLPSLFRHLEGNLKLGNWYHSGIFPDVRTAEDEEEPVLHRHNWGTYFTCDQQIYKRDTDSDAGVGIFYQRGMMTPDDRSSVEDAWGCGLTWTGPFRHRTGDALSIGLSRTTFNRTLRAWQQENDEPFLTSEEVVECGYLYQAAPGLTIRPSIQFIKNSGGDPTLPRSRFFSLRCTAVF